MEALLESGGGHDTTNYYRHRIPNEILFAIGGWSDGTPVDMVETYDKRQVK